MESTATTKKWTKKRNALWKWRHVAGDRKKTWFCSQRFESIARLSLLLCDACTMIAMMTTTTHLFRAKTKLRKKRETKTSCTPIALWRMWHETTTKLRLIFLLSIYTIKSTHPMCVCAECCKRCVWGTRHVPRDVTQIHIHCVSLHMWHAIN